MPIARRQLVEADKPGIYHCVSRCVRRAFLCGDEFEHRRPWIRDRLELLTEIFAIDVISFAVMSNHLHVLVWTDPKRAGEWSATTVARRWVRLFPQSVPSGIPESTIVRGLVSDPSRIETLRSRLSSLSWFMRCLKEPIARRANREDDVTGAFWEGRFKSYRIVDDAGVLTCSVYIDLNPIHAGMADTPEQSLFTSVKERIEDRLAHRKNAGGCQKRQPRKDGKSRQRRRNWLVSFEHPCSSPASAARRSILGLGVDAYLVLVDSIGRVVRGDKRGVIPTAAKPILRRLGIEPEGWLQAVTDGARRLWGTTVGSASGLAGEALRRKTRWVVNPFGELR